MKRPEKFPLRRKKVEKARVVSAHEFQDSCSMVLTRLGWLLIDLVTMKVYIRQPSVYMYFQSLDKTLGNRIVNLLNMISERATLLSYLL